MVSEELLSELWKLLDDRRVLPTRQMAGLSMDQVPDLIINYSKRKLIQLTFYRSI